MQSTIHVYSQSTEGLTEYWVFLDLVKGEDIECPAISNPSGFNYAKAEHIYSCDWVDSQIKIEEFDMQLPNDLLESSEYESIHSSIACAMLSAAGNNVSVHDFLNENIQSAIADYCLPVNKFYWDL